MEPAEFRQLPGSPLPAARAFRVRADDGISLRVALWWPQDGSAPPGPGPAPAPRPPQAPTAYTGPYAGWGTATTLSHEARNHPLREGRAPGSHLGTVLLFPGRTEYVEKYSPVATALAANGYPVLGIDFRGQGASDRLLDDRGVGHIDDFADYQRDVAAMVTAAEALALPRPWHLLAHSMGAAIAIRALSRGLPVASAVLSAPMWGIRFGPLPATVGNGVARGVTRAAGRTGRGIRAVPGPNTVLSTAFHRNLLTSDLEQYIRLMRHAASWPDFAVGPATYNWVSAALRECRALSRLPSPAIPALITLSGADLIVSTAAIRRRAASWPGATLLELPGARHEALFEVEATRMRTLQAALALFAEAGGQAAQAGAAE